MIARRRTGVPVPPSLDGPASAAAVELAANRKKVAAGTPCSFSVYSNQDVKDALAAVFGGKCAYCESRYDRTQPVDVEHFRPKSEVKVGTVKVGGYWWLAAVWTNLLPSCIDCNRARSQEFEGDTAGTGTRGKANQFPLDDEVHRAADETQFQSGKETGHRLLLDPCSDQPEGHLEFRANGTVRSLSRKGRASMEVFALDRRGLNEARRAYALDLVNRLRDFKYYCDRLAEDPDHVPTLERLQALKDELDAKCEDGVEYAALTRTIVDGLQQAIEDDDLNAYLQTLFAEVSAND